jgi:outer membrane protein assembly factor BamA
LIPHLQTDHELRDSCACFKKQREGCPERISFGRNGLTPGAFEIALTEWPAVCYPCPSMNSPAVRIAVFLLLSTIPSLAQNKPPSEQKKLPPKSIRFQGAPQYTQEELLAAAGLKPDSRLTAVEVKAHAKQLNDTGLFAVVKFSTDKQGLLFSLTPSTQLFPIHLDNLPLKPGKELDSTLHAQFPLYHGQLPANGSINDGICRAFEAMLAAQGVKATVKASLTSGLGPQKITAIDFAIISPAVRIGPIQPFGVSAAMQAKVDGLIASQAGNAFDTENSAIGLQHAFEDLYQDQGYAAVQVDVAEADRPVVSGQSSDQAIGIPFAVAIREGGVYKLGSINYPADALVPRAEVDKAVKRTGVGAGRPLDLFVLAVRDAYHARGYLDCSVGTHPSFNEAAHIVSYSVEITPGAVYRMGSVRFDGAPDAIVAKLKSAWKLAPGDAFDESYVSGFAARAQKQDKTLAKWIQTVITTYDVKPDAATHQVNCIFHFAKAAQTAQ